jgi:thermostable 8-oxoguanine DNA glycosylase
MFAQVMLEQRRLGDDERGSGKHNFDRPRSGQRIEDFRYAQRAGGREHLEGEEVFCVLVSFAEAAYDFGF